MFNSFIFKIYTEIILKLLWFNGKYTRKSSQYSQCNPIKQWQLEQNKITKYRQQRVIQFVLLIRMNELCEVKHLFTHSKFKCTSIDLDWKSLLAFEFSLTICGERRTKPVILVEKDGMSKTEIQFDWCVNFISIF